MFEKSSELLPERKEVPKLLRDISGYAKESGLNVTLFKPEDRVVMKDFYAEISFSINIEGPIFEHALLFLQGGWSPRASSTSMMWIWAPPVVIGEDMILKATASGNHLPLPHARRIKSQVKKRTRRLPKRPRNPKPKSK